MTEGAPGSPVLPLVKEAVARELAPGALADVLTQAGRFAGLPDAQRVFIGLAPVALAHGKSPARYAEAVLPFAPSACFEEAARACARLPEADVAVLSRLAERAAEAPLIVGGILEHYYPGLPAFADAILALGERSQWVASELPFGCQALQGQEAALLGLVRDWLVLGDWPCLEGIGYLMDAVHGIGQEDRGRLVAGIAARAREDPRAALAMARDAVPAVHGDGYLPLTLPVPREVPPPAGRDPVAIRAQTDELVEFEKDPKGHFAVSILNGLIRCRHFRGGRHIATLESPAAEDILKTAVRLRLVSSLGHAGWLGGELMRAEIALRKGLPYEQERAP
jgi:hypothetical protein